MNRLFDSDNWNEIFSSLLRNKTRSFLTGFGIFWGVLMLVLLWSGGSGIIAIVASKFSGVATNIAYAVPARTGVNYQGYGKGRTWMLTNSDVASIGYKVDGIDCVVPMCQKWGQTVVTGNKSKQCQVTGIANYYYDLNGVETVQGRAITSVDIRNKAKVVAVGKKIAKDLWPEGNALGQTVTIGGNSFTVVGVITAISDAVSFGGFTDMQIQIPMPVFQATFQYYNTVEGVIVKMKPGVALNDIRPKIESCVFPSHSISADDHGALETMDFAKYFNMAQNILLGMRLLAIIVGAGMLFAGLIGVSNIMMVILKERTNEIGIRRAIGARPLDILMQFLCESTLLTFTAGLGGMAVAVGITAVLQKATGNPFVLSFGESITITMIFVVLGIAAGIMPAHRAMRIKPIEAMNEK